MDDNESVASHSITREPLSLGNFQPGYAKEPYLNTPRSLEACRIHGVKPVDLIEIPFREFRKAYPNDEEAALRRFERVDGNRRIILEAVTDEWNRIVSRGSLTGVNLNDTKKEIGDAIIDVAPEAYTPLLEIQMKRLQKVEEQQWLALKKMVTLQLNEAIQEAKSKQIIAKQDGITEQNELMKRQRMEQREQLLREQREEAKYKEMLNARNVRIEQQKAAVEAQRQKERMKEAEKAEKKRQQKREADRLLQEAYMKKLKEDEHNKMEEEAKMKLKKMKDEAEELERKARAERERKNAEQVRLRNEMLQRIESAKTEQQRKAEEKRKMILDRINTFDQRTEAARAEKERKQREEAALKDKQLQDKINQIKGQSDKIVEAKVQKTLETLQKREATANKELKNNKGELERRKLIKSIKQDAFEKCKNRVRTAEEYRLKRIKDDLAIKDAKAKAIKDGMLAFQALRETLTETVAKTRGELKREAFKLSHKDALTPETLMDVVVENTSNRLFPRLHTTFRPATTASNDRAQTRDSDRPRARSGSPVKPDSLYEDPPKSPLAHAHYTLNDFVEDRLTREMVQTKEQIEKRDAELQLPYSVSLGALRKGNSSPSKDKLNQTLPSRLNENEVENGTMRPATTDGSKRRPRGTILSTPGEKYVNLDVAEEPIDRNNECASAWGNMNPEDFEINGDFEEIENPGRGEQDRRNSKDVTDDENLFFQPVPSLQDSKKNKSGRHKKTKTFNPNGVFKPPTPKKNEFRREYSKDHPLAPGGTGKYEADRAGGQKHPVGWVDNADKNNNKSTTTTLQQQGSPQYPKVVIHQTRSNDDNVRDIATWQAEIDALRRQQNQALLKLLEEERLAEEDRGKMGKLVKDHEERHKLELVFSEERKRASERIISMTRQHEINIKEATGRLPA